MHGEHGRVPGGVRARRGLRPEHVRLHGAGLGGPTGSAQLGPGVLHARGGRTAWPDGIRRHLVAGVRPQPCAAVRVVGRRRFRRAGVRTAASVGSVRGLLLRQRRPSLVRNDQKSELQSSNLIL